MTAGRAGDGFAYDEHWRERATLRDGTEVVLRMVRADDKPLLREGFERLSEQTRYLRFHGVKNELTDAELRYLTEVDGVKHVAIGAVRTDADGAEHGCGIARMVQLEQEPGVAEAAITVADEHQGHGLGTLLFNRIIAAAAERGVTKIRSFVLGSNTPMQELMKRLAPAMGADAHVTVEQGVVTIEIPLPPVERPRESSLYELLRLAARRILELRG